VSKAYHIYIPPLRRVVVRRDVKFEEDRACQGSLESRVSVEDDVEAPIDVSEGEQPQVSGTPVLGVTGSPCTSSGSQSEGVQSEGSEASGSQSVETSHEAVTLGQRDLTSSLTTSGKRRPRWFQETLKEARENVGEPKIQIRESRPPFIFGAYLALVMSIRDTEPQTFV
jgi:hypothetical protein